MDGPPPQRWDRTKWITVFSSHSPTIREVTECLGLGLSPSASTTNRGIPKFDAPEFKKLSSEVTRLSKELPQDREALLDFAADPHALDPELEKLLSSLGPPIWGKDADRSRLVTPDASKKTYYKDLFYEDPDDRDILKIHLQRWIVIKACYYIRNRKLKKHSLGDEYETLADVDAGSPLTHQKPELLVKLPMPSPKLRDVLSPPQSPVATPQSGTPPTEDSPPFGGAVKPVHINDRKRKSSMQMSLSDGDDNSVESMPRKRSYQSATLPIQRKSPRKPSISGRTFSAENIPPTHSQPHHQPYPDSHTHSHSQSHPHSRSPIQTHAHQPHNGGMTPAGPESGRPLLGPLSHNALNGATRPANPSPSTFSAVNAPSGFTAVNAPNAAPNTNNVAIAPNPRPYSSPYGADAQSPPEPHRRQLPNGHSEPPAHHKSLVPREPSPHKTPDVRHASPHVTHATLMAHRPHDLNALNQTNGSNHHNSQQVYHNHSIPAQQPPHSQTQQQQQQQQMQMQHQHQQQISAQQQQQPPAQHQQQQSAQHQQQQQPPTQPQHQPQPQGQAPSQAPAGITNFHPAFSAHHAPNGNRIATAPVLPSNAPLLPVANGHGNEHPRSRAVSPADTTLMQCELLGILMKFFFTRDGPRLEEGTMLHNLEYIWARNEGPFRRNMGHLYELQARVLFAWIEERKKMSQLAYAMNAHPGIREAEMVDRLLAMNDLRVMRLKWKAMKTQDGAQTLSPEDLLCRTFAALTNTEGTEHLFKDGLARLNDDVFEFLRSEDMKISMLKR